MRIQICDAGGRVQVFEPANFISARDQTDGMCIVSTSHGMFGTRMSAADVTAKVEEARAAER